MIKKTLIPTNDLYIQFTEEELSAIGAGPGTKFEAKVHDDGSIELRPYAKVEIDMKDWSREFLETLISMSCEQDISVNDVINNSLKQALENYPTYENFKTSKELLLEKAAIDPSIINSDTSICNNF
jgi:hypothetical protein